MFHQKIFVYVDVEVEIEVEVEVEAEVVTLSQQKTDSLNNICFMNINNLQESKY